MPNLKLDWFPHLFSLNLQIYFFLVMWSKLVCNCCCWCCCYCCTVGNVSLLPGIEHVNRLFVLQLPIGRASVEHYRLFVLQLPIGRASIEHYRLLKRQCVFSHDELVCKMADLPAGALTPHQMQLVYKDLLTMVDAEKKTRKLLHDKVFYSINYRMYSQISWNIWDKLVPRKSAEGLTCVFNLPYSF